MTSQWQPFREPVRRTLFRTVSIAVVAGAAVALTSRKWSTWPTATLLALWPSLGGHWVEVWFLNWLRPRVFPQPGVQRAARILAWFAGGCLLALGMRLTASAFVPWPSPQWLTWWLGGAAFAGVEVVVHLVMQIRGQPSAFDGRG